MNVSLKQRKCSVHDKRFFWEVGGGGNTTRSIPKLRQTWACNKQRRKKRQYAIDLRDDITSKKLDKSTTKIDLHLVFRPASRRIQVQIAEHRQHESRVIWFNRGSHGHPATQNA